MTEEDVLELVKTTPARDALRRLAGISEVERRKSAGAMAKLFKQVRETGELWRHDDSHPDIIDTDTLRVAVIATGVPSELKRFSVEIIPRRLPLSEIVRALAPTWIDRWVWDLVEANPNLVSRVAPLWRDGLCTRPEGDALILGFYAHNRDNDTAGKDPIFLDRDVWRFFEVEGGGEFSLASHDKYCAPDCAWAVVLTQLADQGELDRKRLLDASLDALQRDFGQFRAGWYSRFHTALGPTLDEMALRTARYLRLLGSSVPPTVSFALRALRTLDKAGRLSLSDVLDHIPPALQARQKSIAMAALGLLASTGGKELGRANDVARLAATALISEAADVQSKALDLVEKFGGSDDHGVHTTLEKYVDFVAPSVRNRLLRLVGLDPSTPAETTSDFLEGVRSAPIPIDPIDDLDATLGAFLEVLETPRDPFAVERAMDGLARHGSKALGDAQKLSPLMKRSGQLIRKPGDELTRLVLAATGRAWCEGRTIPDVVASQTADPEGALDWKGSFAHVLLDRNTEILERALSGHALPMLSAPSDTSGSVIATDLLDRLGAYRAVGVEPGATDLNLTLLRLAREGRDAVLGEMKPRTEADRAVAFACGADETPGRDAALWAAAWAARQPTQAHPDIAALFSPPLPDAGQPAVCDIRILRRENDGYHWCVVDVPVLPVPRTNRCDFTPSLYYPPRPNRYLQEAPCGRTVADIAWASLVRPGWFEPFYRQALIAMDTDQKLTDHYCRAYLDPFFRPGPDAGPLATATLVYFLASADKSVTSLTVEAIVQLSTEDRLGAGDLSAAMGPFLKADVLPLARWTKGLSEIAAATPSHAQFARQVIAGLLDFPPSAPPRGIGGMVELLYELHVASGALLDNPAALDCLKSVNAGGKLGRYSKQLLKFAPTVKV